MLDHPQPADDSATIPSSVREKRKASSAISTSQAESRRAVHVVLNSKGGIGKSYVAGLVAQFLREKGEPLVCLDADAQNATLSDIKALRAEPVHILRPEGEVDIRVLDGMVERFLTEDSNFVIDSGSTTFVPLSAHLINPAVVDAIEAAGKRIIVHAIIAGGQELAHCAKGFDSMARQFPPSVGMIVWLNEHHGVISGPEGKGFEHTPVFQAHKHRIAGVVRLSKLNPLTFGANLADMLSRGMTFAEADQSPEFYTMAKQRLRQVQRPIWDQLATVL
jgi:hypothetical protein